MIIESIYSAEVDDMIFVVSVNIGFTLGLIRDSIGFEKNQIYVDGGVELFLHDGITVGIGTEQDFGNLMDFLNAPIEYKERQGGLFSDGFESHSCLCTVNGMSLVSFSLKPLNNRVISFSIENLVPVFSDIKNRILDDLGFIFEKENIATIRSICQQ